MQKGTLLRRTMGSGTPSGGHSQRFNNLLLACLVAPHSFSVMPSLCSRPLLLNRRTSRTTSNHPLLAIVQRLFVTKTSETINTNNNKNNKNDNKDSRGTSVGGFGHLFDSQGADYERFRPDYPPTLYQQIFDFAHFGPGGMQLAVDIGCGTGQVTKILSQYFKKVKGFDPSTKMLENAIKAENICYALGTCDKIDVASASVDLLTSAQAAHWFDLPKFYQELKRVLRPGGVVAIWGYGLCTLPNERASQILYKYHTEVMGDYWDPNRKLLDAGYTHIDLPFGRKDRKTLSIKKQLSFSDFMGYMGTQSCLKTYREKHPHEPNPALQLADMLFEALQLRSGAEEIEVAYPTYHRGDGRKLVIVD
jgi:SAM-dependent methyltransferase